VTAAQANTLTTLNAQDEITITLDAGVTTALVLTSLDDATGVAVGAAAITTISGTATEVKAVLDAHTASTISLDADYKVSITGANMANADVARINSLAADSSGTITGTFGTLTLTQANNLATLDAQDAITLTEVTATANAAAIDALDDKTSGSMIFADAQVAIGNLSSLSLATVNQTITGTGGKMLVTGTAGGDTMNFTGFTSDAGNGFTIKGAAAADFITLTDDTNSSDIIAFEVKTGSGTDNITGFSVGATGSGGDVLNFNIAHTANAFGGGGTGVVSGTLAGVTIGTNSFIQLTDRFASTTDFDNQMQASASIDEANIGDRVIVYELADSVFGVAIVSNDDVTDNGDVTIDHVGQLGGFADTNSTTWLAANFSVAAL